MEMLWILTLKFRLWNFLLLQNYFNFWFWILVSIQSRGTECRDTDLFGLSGQHRPGAEAGVGRAVSCSLPTAHPSSQIHLIWVWQVPHCYQNMFLFMILFLAVLTEQVSIVIKSWALCFSVWLEMFWSLYTGNCWNRVPGLSVQPKVVCFRTSIGWALWGGCCACCGEGICSHSPTVCVAPTLGLPLLQRISNSTSGLGAVWALPKLSAMLNWSANNNHSHLSNKAAEEASESL